MPSGWAWDARRGWPVSDRLERVRAWEHLAQQGWSLWPLWGFANDGRCGCLDQWCASPGYHSPIAGWHLEPDRRGLAPAVPASPARVRAAYMYPRPPGGTYLQAGILLAHSDLIAVRIGVVSRWKWLLDTHGLQAPPTYMIGALSDRGPRFLIYRYAWDHTAPAPHVPTTLAHGAGEVHWADVIPAPQARWRPDHSVEVLRDRPIADAPAWLLTEREGVIAA